MRKALTLIKNLFMYAYCHFWLKGEHDLYPFWDGGIEHKYCHRCKAEWRYDYD